MTFPVQSGVCGPPPAPAVPLAGTGPATEPSVFTPCRMPAIQNSRHHTAYLGRVTQASAELDSYKIRESTGELSE